VLNPPTEVLSHIDGAGCRGVQDADYDEMPGLQVITL
jgi:hypothetical protein